MKGGVKWPSHFQSTLFLLSSMYTFGLCYVAGFVFWKTYSEAKACIQNIYQELPHVKCKGGRQRQPPPPWGDLVLTACQSRLVSASTTGSLPPQEGPDIRTSHCATPLLYCPQTLTGFFGLFVFMVLAEPW